MERQRLRGLIAPEPASIAKLAAFVIRWPHPVSAFGSPRDGRAHPLALLEDSALQSGIGNEKWVRTLQQTGLAADDAQPPEWTKALHHFLTTGPTIRNTALHLL